jgi:Tfp pilus assembly protein FimT
MGGFTVTELMIVMLITAVVTSIAFQSYDRYLDRTSARRSAETFARDLTLARSQAVRSRQAVTLLFNESAFVYYMRTSAGDTLITRFWDGQNESLLETMDLSLTGDSLRFSSRGMADISSAGASLATATFAAGNFTYDVSFNSMGTSSLTSR